MPNLLLKFYIDLEDISIPYHVRHHGPLFHRWLPDGKKNRMTIPVGHPDYILEVWFERFGSVQRGFIEFDVNKREVDSEIIPKQAILEAGPLFGRLLIRNFSGQYLEPLRKKDLENEEYKELGKKIINILVPPVKQFLGVLRINYGQYWLPDLPMWDSRDQSLGSYCKYQLHLKWSEDDGKIWTDFLPTKEIHVLRSEIVMGKDYSEFFTEADWHQLSKTMEGEYELSSAACTLAEAHKEFDQGNLQNAFIRGITALELALSMYIRQKLKDDHSLQKDMQSFWGLPRKAQLVALSVCISKISSANVKHAVDAIDIRDAIVHKGVTPIDSRDTENVFMGLLRAIAALLPEHEFKFPTASSGNEIAP